MTVRIGGGVFYPFPYLGKTIIDIFFARSNKKNIYVFQNHGGGIFKKYIITCMFRKMAAGFLLLFPPFSGV